MSYKIINGKIVKSTHRRYRGAFGGLKDWEQVDPSVVGSESWKPKSKIKFRQLRKTS